MRFPMFFSTWIEANDFGFHEAIMNDTAWMAFGIALVVGGLSSLIYYLVVGKSARMSNLLTWFIAMLIGLAINYSVTDRVLVGSPVDKKSGVDTKSLVYKYSFFYSIDNHATNLIKSDKYKNNPEAKKKINKYKVELSKQITKGEDIVFSYELSCLFWTLLAFVFVSYCVKNSTEQASSIPTYWPQKRNRQ